MIIFCKNPLPMRYTCRMNEFFLAAADRVETLSLHV